MRSNDSLGRILTMTETVEGTTADYAYAYTPSGQLESVERDGAEVQSYTYDSQGNRTSYTNADTAESYVPEDYIYDAQDRLLARGDTSYVYNARGQLEQRTVDLGVLGECDVAVPVAS